MAALRGERSPAAARGGVGGRLRGAKLSRLRCRVPGLSSPPAALPGREKGTDPAPAAGPTAPLSAARARPARSKVSLRNLAAAATSPWKRPPGFPPLPRGRGGGGRQSGPARRELGGSGRRTGRDGTGRGAGRAAGPGRGSCSTSRPGEVCRLPERERGRRDQAAERLLGGAARAAVPAAPPEPRICRAGPAPAGSGAAAAGRSHRGAGSAGGRPRCAPGVFPWESAFPGGLGVCRRCRGSWSPPGVGPGARPPLTPVRAGPRPWGRSVIHRSVGVLHLGCN